MRLFNYAVLYIALENRKIKIWVDGGWCVDAHLGQQTRPHEDLDIAIQQVGDVKFFTIV